MAETSQKEAINRIKKAVEVWKFTVAEWAKQDMGGDKQKYLLPNIPFRSLTLGYENSFLLWGIVEQISTSADSGFAETGDKQVDDIVRFLDHQLGFSNLYIYGNYFVEIVQKRWAGQLPTFEPMITQTVKIKRETDKGRLVNKTYIQETSGNTAGITFENNKEIYHYKGASLTNKFYGDAKWSKCITQICLLEIIDQFYEEYFNNGLINPFLLAVENGELSEEELETINKMIKDSMRGKDNAFAGLTVPVKLAKIDLSNELKTDDFLKYRNDLIKSISICLNIPYGMLLNDSSNRATSEVELEKFNKDIIVPLQNRYLKQLREMLIVAGYNPTAVESLEFKTVDTRNQKEIMEVATGYKKSGVLTANEAREYAGWERIEGNPEYDTLTTQKDNTNNQLQNDIQQSLAKIYTLRG